MEYSKENILDYKNAYDEAEYEKLPDCKESIFKSVQKAHHYIKIQVPVKLRGGISIRRYSAKKGEPDYRHLTSGRETENPVISGMSCTGAVRRRVKEILYQMHVPKAGLLLDAIFGYMDEEGLTKGYEWFVQNHRYYDSDRGQKRPRLDSWPKSDRMAQNRTQHKTMRKLPEAGRIYKMPYKLS